MRTCSLLIAATCSLVAQSFEVATIKPNAAADNRVSIGIQPGGRFTATGMPLRLLIGQAYDLREFQITGGPSWIDNERYDINAKAEGLDGAPGGPDALRPYFKSLLAERFGFKAHEETKEQPIYALTLGKGEHKMKKSEGENRMGNVRMGRGLINAQGIPVSELVRMMAQPLRRTVVDKTGLKGNFDVKLEWSPEAADANGPSIFTAVQEQLGLKLEADKGPGRVLVIDQITKPTEN